MTTCDQIDGDRFWPNYEFSFLLEKIICVRDPNDIKMQGDWLGDFSGKALFITLSRCTGEDYCALENEIDAFINSHSIFYSMNFLRYNPNDYTESVL